MAAKALSKSMIYRVVNQYIGITEGYLGDMRYGSHREFYPKYCDLDIVPDEFPGTTRERFIAILSAAEPADQAKILRGVLDRFPVGAGNGPDTRTSALAGQILEEIRRLEGGSPIASPSPDCSLEVVDRALKDAEALIEANGATSAVDRVHTALHGYLKSVCDSGGIALPADPTLPAIFKMLRENHAAFRAVGPRGQDVTQILRASGSILDAMNPLRNQASMAHPNETLLPAEEAMLVINISRSVIHYIDAKLSAWDGPE